MKLNGFMDSAAAAFGNVASSLANSAPQILAIYQAKQCIDLNVQRQRNNLAPIDCTSTSAAQIQVGLSPDTKKYIAIGAVAIVGALVHVYMARKK
jgi:hypothetical protein